MAQIFVDVETLILGVSIQQGALTVTNQGSSVDLFNGDVACNAVVMYGAGSGATTAVTTCNVQIEEWSGTTVAGQFSGNGATTWAVIPGMIGATVATTNATTQTLQGLRTQRWARANAVTFNTSTNANVPLTVLILEQPKSEGGATFGAGFSNWPSSGSTNGT